MSASLNLTDFILTSLSRRSAIRRSAVGDRSRGQPLVIETVACKSRSRRGSVSAVSSPFSVAYNMSPRRCSEACSESSEVPSLMSRSCGSDNGSVSDSSSVTTYQDEVELSKELDDRSFFNQLLNGLADCHDNCEATSDFDTLFASSGLVTSARDNEFMSVEELLSLLGRVSQDE